MITATKTACRYQVLSTDDLDVWQSFLPASVSVFGSAEFGSIMETHCGYQPRLFVFAEGESVVAYPFFLRPISDLPFLPQGIKGWDIKSPEYTGPVPMTSLHVADASSFKQAFHQFCQQEGVIAEFAHLHPWHRSQPLLEPRGIAHNRQIVYVDLSLSPEQLWENAFTYACRKNIQRALRENVRVFPASSAEEIGEFYRIYTGTMKRNEASSQYYFSLDYFLSFFHKMSRHALFMLAEYQGQIVAGTLYLHDDRDVYSYLGGADHAFQQLRPTNAIVYETIRWSRLAEKSRLVLGGGYLPDDGIFRFKSSFSPLRADFYTYKMIHVPAAYESLRRCWSAFYHSQPDGVQFFPIYRAEPVSLPEG